jgi:hypothetical protein
MSSNPGDGTLTDGVLDIEGWVVEPPGACVWWKATPFHKRSPRLLSSNSDAVHRLALNMLDWFTLRVCFLTIREASLLGASFGALSSLLCPVYCRRGLLEVWRRAGLCGYDDIFHWASLVYSVLGGACWPQYCGPRSDPPADEDEEVLCFLFGVGAHSRTKAQDPSAHPKLPSSVRGSDKRPRFPDQQTPAIRLSGLLEAPPSCL